MRLSLALVTLLASLAHADIYRPLSFDGCHTYDLDCTECTRNLGGSEVEDTCVTDALAQGRELACNKRRGSTGISYYCAPGLSSVVVKTSGMHWLLGWGLALVAGFGAFRWGRRRRTPTA